MKKALMAVILGLMMSCATVYAAEEVSIETEITTVAIEKGDFSPQLIERIKAERNTIYNALNLTPEQICKKDIIEQKRYEELEPELKKLCIGRQKLKKFTCEKSDNTQAIKNAQKEVNTARKEIKSISNKYDREFKKILTSEQKAKYNMIRKLKRADLKKIDQKKKTTSLRPFGVPVSQAEYAEQQKKNNCWYKLFKCNK